MTDLLNTMYYGNTLLQWLTTVIIILASVVLARVIYRIFRNWIKFLTKKTKTQINDIIIDLIEKPVLLIVIIFGVRLGIGRLTLSENVQGLLNNATKMAVTLVLTWLIALIYDVFHQNYITQLTKGTEPNFGGQILPLIRTIIKLIIWSLGLLIGLKNAGFDVGAMLAGLGIGGLAFALAAQDTVSNMFGGITIFLQRPFKVDDLIMFEGKEMIVKEIGLRATRLTDESYGHTIYIPNSMFTGGIITNISAEPGFWFYKSIYLTKNTTATQIDSVVKLILDVLNGHPDVDGTVCYYKGYAAGGHEIYYCCRIKSSDIKDRVQTEFNLSILRQLEHASIGLV